MSDAAFFVRKTNFWELEHKWGGFPMPVHKESVERMVPICSTGLAGFGGLGKWTPPKGKPQEFRASWYPRSQKRDLGHPAWASGLAVTAPDSPLLAVE